MLDALFAKIADATAQLNVADDELRNALRDIEIALVVLKPGVPVQVTYPGPAEGTQHVLRFSKINNAWTLAHAHDPSGPFSLMASASRGTRADLLTPRLAGGRSPIEYLITEMATEISRFTHDRGEALDHARALLTYLRKDPS